MREDGPPVSPEDEHFDYRESSDLSVEELQKEALLLEKDESSVRNERGLKFGINLQKRLQRYSGGAKFWICSASCCGLAALIVLLVILFFIFSLSSSVAGRQNSLSSPSDYVLDSAWDFNEVSTRRHYEWIIEDKELNPDGVYRPLIVINNVFPGPLIECNEGDTLVVQVQNRATNATSIHWHGLFQNGTNWMDGTVGVTNCPIGPGQQFTYEFKVSGQSGTYYYHAHQGMQASDGIFGPLIVHSKYERSLQKLPYVSDRVIMVHDHYHDLTSSLLMQYLQSGRENVEPVPDGALINGRNIRNCDDFPHRKCNNSTATQPFFQLSATGNHRLRFINTGALAEFQVQVDEHEFAVTEVDGTDVLPAYYHRLNISPGQRYSIVLSPQIEKSDLFWLRARMVTLCFREENPYMEPEIRAVISFGNEKSHPQSHQTVLPTSLDWPDVVETQCRDMDASQLIPAHQIAAPAHSDAFFYIRSNFEIGAWRLSRGFFNKSSWRPDVQSPTLHRLSLGLSEKNQNFSLPNRKNSAIVNDVAFDANRELVIQTTGSQVLDLLIQNFDDGNHPMHLHGYKYFVLANGHGGFDRDKVYSSLNLTNPLRRDTASLEGYGWLLIRVIADNPGVWAFHCHISWHTEAGLLMQFVIRTELMETWRIPVENRALCQAAGLELGMAPPDETFYHEDNR